MLRGDTQKFLKGDIEITHREAETGDKEGIKSLQPNCVCVCVVCVLCVCVVCYMFHIYFITKFTHNYAHYAQKPC